MRLFLGLQRKYQLRTFLVSNPRGNPILTELRDFVHVVFNPRTYHQKNKKNTCHNANFLAKVY